MSCWGAWQGNEARRPRDIPGVSDAVDLAVGGTSLCIVRARGTVACLGRLARYQPDLDALSAVRTVAVGASSLCTLGSDDSVHCFGDIAVQSDDHGVVPLLAGSKQIVLGAEHGCALGATGHVSCWGDNSNGQLARDGHRKSDEPVTIDGATDVVELAAGQSHTCAKRKDGTLVCWGSTEAYIQRPKVEGGGTTMEIDDVYSDVAPVPGVSNVIALAAGNRATCAIEQDGQAVCFGQNLSGELGIGTTESHWPQSKLKPAETSGILIAMGRSHACAVVADSQVHCWGADEHGELGYESASPFAGGPPMSLVPGRVEGL